MQPVSLHIVSETFGFCVIGLITGEALHRLSLYLEDRDHGTPARAVLSDRHQQHWKSLCLVLLAALVILTESPAVSWSEVFLRTLPFTVIWALLRIAGVLENSIDDETILKERHAELGPGLAASYWLGFLQIILTSHHLGGDSQTIEVKMREFCQSKNVKEAYHDKIFIFLSENCNFYDQQVTLEREERIFRFLPTNSKLEFKLKGKDKKRMFVHWIFEHLEDEDRFIETGEQDEDARKILFIFDFPSTLRRAMGPGSISLSKEARKRNLESFKSTLQCLAGNRRNAIEFIEFKLKSRRLNNLDRRPLSHLIRTNIEEYKRSLEAAAVDDEN